MDCKAFIFATSIDKLLKFELSEKLLESFKQKEFIILDDIAHHEFFDNEIVISNIKKYLKEIKKIY